MIGKLNFYPQMSIFYPRSINNNLWDDANILSSLGLL